SAMVVGHDHGRIKSDARPDRTQAIVEHLIFEWKIPVRESANSPEDLSAVRRVVWREIRGVDGPTTRQEFAELTEIACPRCRVRVADWTNSASDPIVDSVLEYRADTMEPIRFGFAV